LNSCIRIIFGKGLPRMIVSAKKAFADEDHTDRR
jgi:hypothetical protein